MLACLSGPAGTVAVASATLARYQEFYFDLDRLEVPVGSVFEPERGARVEENFNRILRTRFQGDWFWVLGDDHRFRPDTLRRLLAHQVDVVVPVACWSLPPFLPVLWQTFEPEREECRVYGWAELSLLHGLIPVAAVGSAGMLLSRRALEAVGDPWFDVAKVGENHIGEDVSLCLKLRRAGFPIYVDLDTTIGHINLATCWPRRGPDGEWRVDGVMRDRWMTFIRPGEIRQAIPDEMLRRAQPTLVSA